MRQIPDTQELGKVRPLLEEVKTRCKKRGFYGICYAQRGKKRPDTMASVTVYYDSAFDQIVAIWQKGGKGPIRLATFAQSVSRGMLEGQVRDALEWTTLLNRKKRLKEGAKNGDILAEVRAIIRKIWQECWEQGFVGRPSSRRRNHSSDIPGSNITMLAPERDEIVVIWEKNLVGPVEIATFVRVAGPGVLEREIRTIIGFPNN